MKITVIDIFSQTSVTTLQLPVSFDVVTSVFKVFIAVAMLFPSAFLLFFFSEKVDLFLSFLLNCACWHKANTGSS